MKVRATIFTVMLTLPIILVNAQAASVMNLAPHIGKPGQPVNIIGSGFDNCDSIAVKFGGRPLPSATQNGDKIIKFVVPNVSPGWYGVSVVCNGVDTPNVTFTVK